MKKQLEFTQNKLNLLKKAITVIGIAFIGLLSINYTYAQTNTVTTSQEQQQRNIKGTVSDESGVLEGVSIIKKGTVIGTATDRNGAFTFPKALKTGDILLFSYLGYEEVEVIIKENTTDIKLILTQDVVEMMGALQTNTPYKSDRSKKKN